ncbi:DUF6998 domain-containing protein [Mangrovimonas aestuarii]|uniref:DUF6998 domain-containing protein n=1 Tax=Mangrovimonas aestuarii TaxID=3018443 RepID=UPI0023796AFD|nr:hypothetical protein [Mangrovimonas aestuarii]
MQEIKELLELSDRLKEKFVNHNRNFTLDGKLVGDIGEVLVAENYGLTLLRENKQNYDAKEESTGRLVQIKSSFKENFYFPYRHTPEFYIAVKILPTGDIEEIFNGTGKMILDNYIKERNLKGYSNLYYKLSANILRELNEKVPKAEKIGSNEI